MSDQEIHELIQVRLQKVNDLRAKGIEPYGGRFERTNLAQDIKKTLRPGSKRFG